MIRAILFDFDEVVAADQTPHLRCFQQALAERGLLLTKDNDYGAYLGMDKRTVRLSSSPRAITDPKAMLFREYIAIHKPARFPGFVEFVKRAGVQYR